MNKLLILFISCFFVVLGSQTPLATAQEKETSKYSVGIGDVLSINVLQPDHFETKITVAPDGSIMFPYIGSVRVEGRGLEDIQNEIEGRLAEGYMKYPVVAVSLLESHSKKFFVYGEVVKPGSYLLEQSMTILRGISMAGGFNKFGSSSRVKVLRLRKQGTGYENIKINLKNVMDGEPDADILLQSGDIIVVSEGIF